MDKICCFSRQNNNYLLWSHYAGHHRGFCLEFNVLDNIDFFLPIFPIIYRKEYAPANLWEAPGAIAEQMFQRKSDVWEYEDEVRVIKNGAEARQVEYKPESLKSVIFGCRATKETIEKVKEVLKETVQYKRIVLSETEYHLDVVNL